VSMTDATFDTFQVFADQFSFGDRGPGVEDRYASARVVRGMLTGEDEREAEERTRR
jgi:hypothetical protein